MRWPLITACNGHGWAAETLLDQAVENRNEVRVLAALAQDVLSRRFTSYYPPALLAILVMDEVRLHLTDRTIAHLGFRKFSSPVPRSCRFPDSAVASPR